MINCLVAVERNQGIGFNGQMPWPHLKGDMTWFKKLTTNNVIIMGSTTYHSIGKNLPNRINIVVSKRSSGLGDYTISNPYAAINFATKQFPEKEIFIIGGSQLYEFLKFEIDKFYVTEIDHEYPCDRFFDYDYVKQEFTKVKEHATFTDPIKYTIKEYNL